MQGLFAISAVGAALLGSTAANAAPSKPGTVADSVFSHLPADQQGRLSAQDKARTAADRISQAVGQGGAGFAGIELNGGAVRLYYHGELPAAVNSAVKQARGTAAVDVLPAEHSLAELQPASDRMLAYLRAHPGGPAHRVSIPVSGSGLVVGVDATFATASIGLPDVGVPVQVAVQDRVQPRARGNDTRPFYGGGRISSSDYIGCTAGFGVIKDGHKYMLTAGHCGYIGQLWYNGNHTQTIGAAAYENVDQDLLLISAENAAGSSVFTGVGTSTAVGSVIGWAGVYTGEELCSSGATSTWLCGHRVIDAGNSSYCAYDPYGNWECYSGLIWSQQENGAISLHDGDSGGPVVLPTSSGLIAKGTISGGGGADLLWQDFATAAAIWGIHPA
jgi:hypothetical protein